MRTQYITLKLGIKKNKIDGLLIKLQEKSFSSMLSTKNKFAAAPVIISKKCISKYQPKYIFINSGNANACTGNEGYNNAIAIQTSLANKLDCKKEQILLMSTGIIGRQLPIKNIKNSIEQSTYENSSTLKQAASAIMTTDKYPKYLKKSYSINSKNITFSGICKGAGMIHPDMATMLAYIETDACINRALLKKITKTLCDISFNAISVDGDMSTNDTVVFTTTNKIDININDQRYYKKILKYGSEFFTELASQIVRDGEGSTKVIELNINNCKTKTLANEISLKISNSLLVKTAMYGSDPNWGRIVASLGSVDSPDIDIKKIRLFINDLLVFKNGIPVDQGSQRLKKTMKNKNIKISIDLSTGKHSSKCFFSDLSHEYVTINSEYTT